MPLGVPPCIWCSEFGLLSSRCSSKASKDDLSEEHTYYMSLSIFCLLVVPHVLLSHSRNITHGIPTSKTYKQRGAFLSDYSENSDDFKDSVF